MRGSGRLDVDRTAHHAVDFAAGTEVDVHDGRGGDLGAVRQTPYPFPIPLVPSFLRLVVRRQRELALGGDHGDVVAESELDVVHGPARARVLPEDAVRTPPRPCGAPG